MAHNYSFPILKNAEVLLCLHELAINATEDDLVKPTPLKVQMIYSQFIELLLNKKREDMAQPAFSGINELEYPQELHEDSVPMVGFLHACQELMQISGINDFTMHDVSKPEYKRLRRNISAMINFAKFREERLDHYMKYSEETDALASKKQGLEEENERLLTERRAAEAKRAQEAPEEQRLNEENAERETVVRELWNKQTAVQKESQTLKAQLHEVQDKTRETKCKLLDMQKELEELRAQVVDDPQKLMQEMASLTAAVQAEKQAVKELELKRWECTQQREVLSGAERVVNDLLQLQSEVEAEQAKLKEVTRSKLNIAERQARQEGERGEQMHQLKSTTQRLQHARERMERQRELHSTRMQDANAALQDAQQQWGELHNERETHYRQQENNESAVRELRDKLVVARFEDEQAAARMQQLQQHLASQVRAYHQNLYAATGNASSQAPVPVA